MDTNEFSYGGIESGTFGITGDFETHSILPAQRKYVKEIPGVDGVIDFGIGGYGVRVISVPIYYDGDYATLRANREQIIAWLSNTRGAAKQLIFGNDPAKYYMAKCYAEVSFQNTNDRLIGTIQFECNPPWQYYGSVQMTPEQIAWNTHDALAGNQWFKTFAASGSLRLTNTGTQAVKPIIKLMGNIPAGLTLSCGAQSWQYDAALTYDGIEIDCENGTVTRMSDGVNLIGNCDPCDFFELAAGQVEIGLTASGLGAWPSDVTMIVEFVPVGV